MFERVRGDDPFPLLPLCPDLFRASMAQDFSCRMGVTRRAMGPRNKSGGGEIIWAPTP
jgi:hypothetical protein